MNVSTPRVRARSLLVPLVLVSAAGVGLLTYSSLTPSSSASPSIDDGPAARQLKPGLVKALRDARTDAADVDITIDVNSGWRSPEHQNELFRKAVLRYGSEDNAARWVATPETSPHVSGDAIDVGPTDAMSWLSQHGAAHGLCQIYANEPWHYELRPGASSRGCPRMFTDPTEDPRMQP